MTSAPVDAPFAYRPLAKVLEDLARATSWRESLRKLPTFKKENGKSVKAGEVDFLPWYSAADYLDEHAPGWETELALQWTEAGVQYLALRLTVWGWDEHGQLRSVSRTNVGNEEHKMSGYGDPGSNAIAQALTRCVALFGGHRELYHKDRGQEGRGRSGPPQGGPMPATRRTTRKAAGPRKAAGQGQGTAPSITLAGVLKEGLDYGAMRRQLNALQSPELIKLWAKEVKAKVPEDTEAGGPRDRLLADAKDRHDGLIAARGTAAV